MIEYYSSPFDNEVSVCGVFQQERVWSHSTIIIWSDVVIKRESEDVNHLDVLWGGGT